MLSAQLLLRQELEACIQPACLSGVHCTHLRTCTAHLDAFKSSEQSKITRFHAVHNMSQSYNTVISGCVLATWLHAMPYSCINHTGL